MPVDRLRDYRPEPEEPADFDAFWQATLKSATHPDPLIRVRPVDSGLRLV
ncbi:acetylxylan esterase, partial [Streptomyces sp. NPDC056728]